MRIAWGDKLTRAELVHTLVEDALSLLGACERAEDPESASAISPLALVAGQDVEIDEKGRWPVTRQAAKDRVISVVEPEARHMHKSDSHFRDGYEAHLAVEPEAGVFPQAR